MISIGWRVTCPQGHLSRAWSETQTAQGYPSIMVHFFEANCAACPSSALCTQAETGPRSLKLRSQEEYLALQAVRERQFSDDFQSQYQPLAGIEGTISQDV